MTWDYRDPLLIDAAKVIIANDNASASFLQRKLSIGYARAAMILDKLQKLGVISSANGVTARKILIKDIEVIKNLTEPRKLTTEELQDKVAELDMKVNQILSALNGMLMHLLDTYEEVPREEIKDELISEAAKFSKEKNGKVSASQLQRKLNIGYARAARIIDELKDTKQKDPNS